MQVWDLVKSWNDKQRYIQDSPFVGLPVEDIDKEVQTFFKDAYALHKKVNNKVPWRSSIAAMRCYLSFFFPFLSFPPS